MIMGTRNHLQRVIFEGNKLEAHNYIFFVIELSGKGSRQIKIHLYILAQLIIFDHALNKFAAN